MMSKQAYVKTYPLEFRDKVVSLVQVGDRSARQVAEEFGVLTDSVRRWVQPVVKLEERRLGAQAPQATETSHGLPGARYRRSPAAAHLTRVAVASLAAEESPSGVSPLLRGKRQNAISRSGLDLGQSPVTGCGTDV